MNKKGSLLAPAVAALLVGGGGMAMGTTTAAATPVNSVVTSVTDKSLSDADSVRTPGGKYVSGTSTYTRNRNSMRSHIQVATPYLFVGARGTLTTTVYGKGKRGAYPLWVVSHSLPACGLLNPTCTHKAVSAWMDTPPSKAARKIQKEASSIVVKVTVR